MAHNRLNVGQTFGVGLDVTTTKKVIKVFREDKCTLRENPRSAYEKRPPPYVVMGPSE